MLRFGWLIGCAVVLAGCGGGGGGGLAGAIQGGSDACSNDGQKQFVLDTMRTWYFWNDLLPANVDINQFESPEALLASLTTVQPLDSFSFIDLAADDAAFFGEGQFVGFGFSTTEVADNDFRFVRVFSGSPADNGGLERGQQLLAVDGRTVAEIEANEGLGAAFGPSEEGVVRTLTIRRADTTEFDAVLTKAVVTIDPVPQVKTFDFNGTQVGYIEFATFISTAEVPLDAAFAQFNTAGITDLIIDLRYNGGGLVSIAELLGDYLGGQVAAGLVFSETLFNADQAANNSLDFFQRLTNSMNLNRVVVLTTRGTASASELVINSLEPHVSVQLVGAPTFGKPVGQSGFLFCEKILRPTTFETVNSLGEGQYFDGLPVDCAANDDVSTVVGTEADPMTFSALSLLTNGTCPGQQQGAPKTSAPIVPFSPPVPRTTAQAEAYAW